MKKLSSFILVSLLFVTFSASQAFATAIPKPPPAPAGPVYFGGPIGTIIGCVNTVIYTVLGPPRGGKYLWSPSVTQTYAFGPPSHGGQWLLGEAGPNYFCIESVLPLIVHPGLLMVMMASSQ